MHELFLTAVVQDNDVLAARSVLQGYCGISEQHQLSRVLYYCGPDRPKGFKNLRDIDTAPNRKAWNDLNQFLSKQSFIMQLRYNVEMDAFGKEAGSTADLDGKRGILRWSDIADPLPPKAFHTQRRMLEIRNQDRLLSIMGQNAHTLKNECIEETYNWWLNSVEYSLERILVYPQDASGQNQPPRATPSPRSSLPAFSEMRPLSSSWMLRLKVFVPEPTPELMTQAVTLLGRAQRDFQGVFDFRQFDRRVHDTRVMGAPVSNMPIPLPQVVTVDRA